MMPFEEAPQIKKLPESSQNSGVLKARDRTPLSRVSTGAFATVPGSGAGLSSAEVSPSGAP
jgi:hypothetical protein